MKLKSKEINIFSMSALDLFASALGAFILITIALLPFYPNTGDSLERVKDIKEELQQSQAALEKSEENLQQEKQKSSDLEEDLEKSQEELKKRVEEESSVKLPPLDLVIALDTTRSMDYQVAGLRQDIDELTEILSILADDLGIGLIDFKDRCEPATSVRTMPIQKIEGNALSRLKRFTGTMRADSPRCNTTPPESFTEALVEAAGMGWRPSSKKRAIVIISDNPAHADLRQRGLDTAREFASRSSAKHTVSTVFVNSTGPKVRDVRQYLESVAKAGNGKYVVEGSGSSFTITILKALVD